MKEGVCKLIYIYRERKDKSIRTLMKSTVHKQEAPVELQGWMVLVWFLGYVLFGAIMLAIMNPTMSAMGALYNTFTALTGGDVKPLTDGRYIQYIMNKLLIFLYRFQFSGIISCHSK